MTVVLRGFDLFGLLRFENFVRRTIYRILDQISNAHPHFVPYFLAVLVAHGNRFHHLISKRQRVQYPGGPQHFLYEVSKFRSYKTIQQSAPGEEIKKEAATLFSEFPWQNELFTIMSISIKAQTQDFAMSYGPDPWSTFTYPRSSGPSSWPIFI